MAERLLVIGGGGGMGLWLVDHVFSAVERLDIVVADSQSVTAAERLGPRAATLSAVTCHYPPCGGVAGIDDLGGFDAVLLAVPMAQVGRVAGALLPALAADTLVITICSQMAAGLDVIAPLGGERLAVLAMHPLFGPALANPVGQTVALCPVGLNATAGAKWVRAVVEAVGAVVVEAASAAEHDLHMRHVQGATHFALMTFFKMLQALQVDLQRAWEFQTPPFRMLSTFAGRLVQNPELAASIQQVAGGVEMRQSFLQAARSLDEIFAQGNLERSTRELEAVASYLSPSQAERCQAVSGAVIASEQRMYSRLDALRVSGELCGVQQGDRVRLGRVVGIDVGQIRFSDQLVPADGDGPFALRHTAAAAAAARELGFHVPQAPVRELKRDRFRLLTNEEMERWMRRHLADHRVSVTLGVPLNADAAAIGYHLTATVPAIVECDLRDTYRRAGTGIGGDVVWATYAIRLDGQQLKAQALADINQTAAALGYVDPSTAWRNKQAHS